MQENLEESVLANGIDIAIAGEPGAALPEVSGADPLPSMAIADPLESPSSSASPIVPTSANSLEKALNESQTTVAAPASRFVADSNEAAPPPQSRRGAAVMPQGPLLKIPVNVQVILGTTRMSLAKVMALGPGSIVALDKELSEPVTLLVNGNEVARGLIVVVDEKTGQLGVSLTEVATGAAGENAALPV